MLLDEILAFAQLNAPMLRWYKTKDILGYEVVKSNHKAWEIELRWFEPSKYYPECAIDISIQEKNSGSSGAYKVGAAKEALLRLIGKVDKELLEDVQISLF